MRVSWRCDDVWRRRLSALVVPVLVVAGVVLLGEVGSVGLFESPGWASAGEWWAWLDTVSAERALAVAARLVALGFGYYALGSFVVYTLAVAVRVPGLLRAVEWGTLPLVRRLAHRLIAVSLTVSAGVVGPGAGVVGAVEVPVPVPGSTVVVDVARAAGEADEPDPAVPEVEPPLQMAEVIGVPATVRDVPPHAPPFPADEVRVEPVLADEYVVQPGDHLWGIAARRVAGMQVGGSVAVSDPQVAAYWVRLIDVNQPRLRSGDPNLIFPGEVLVLPDHEGR